MNLIPFAGWRRLQPYVFLTVVILLMLHQRAMAAPLDANILTEPAYPLGPPMTEERYRVGSFSAMDRLFPSHIVKKGDTVLQLKRAQSPPQIRYVYNGTTSSIEEYLKRWRITGLLVIKNNEILFERYQHNRTETDRLVSNSIAKSITSLAIGVALRDGLIVSMDDPASRYVPELKNSGYGRTSIRNLLRMSSGIRFREDYSGDDDLPNFIRTLMESGAFEALKPLTVQGHAEGTHFHYASPETLVLGLVLRSCTGKTLAEYVSEKLWQPMGAEANASWVIGHDGMEWAFTKFNAVLRDYGRLGILLANDGILNGRSILPASYLIEATDRHRHPAPFQPGVATPRFGYGYHFWLLPGNERRFVLKGIFGQMIYVTPGTKTVIVQTAAERYAEDEKMWHEFEALVEGIERPPVP